MKTIVSIFAAKSYLLCKTTFLLCLTCSLVLSACAPTPTPAPTLAPISVPTIIPARPCDLEPGGTIPLAAMGVPGNNIIYSWSASAGLIVPLNGPTVNYTAPETAGSVIIKVVAQKGDQTSEGIITCNVVAIPTATSTETPVPTPTETMVPTFTPSPCQGSSSSELIEKAWKALGDNDPDMVLACTQTIIANWSIDADKLQTDRMDSNTCVTAVPSPKDTNAVNAFHAKYWALNDVATAWFLSGEALTKLNKTERAKEAYQTVVKKYSCGYAWDPNGPWFWNVAEAAQKK
jgi:hypothetical protein